MPVADWITRPICIIFRVVCACRPCFCWGFLMWNVKKMRLRYDNQLYVRSMNGVYVLTCMLRNMVYLTTWSSQVTHNCYVYPEVAVGISSCQIKSHWRALQLCCLDIYKTLPIREVWNKNLCLSYEFAAGVKQSKLRAAPMLLSVSKLAYNICNQ